MTDDLARKTFDRIATELWECYTRFNIGIDVDGILWAKEHDQDEAMAILRENKLKSWLRTDFKNVCQRNNAVFSHQLFERMFRELLSSIRASAKEHIDKGDFENNPIVFNRDLDYTRII